MKNYWKMKISKKYNLVKRLLEQGEEYRDDYLKLLARVWYDEMAIKSMSAFDFLHGLRTKQYSHAESIMRARRKVQEEHPELRGKNYKVRTTTAVKETQLDLGYKI